MLSHKNGQTPGASYFFSARFPRPAKNNKFAPGKKIFPVNVERDVWGSSRATPALAYLCSTIHIPLAHLLEALHVEK